MHVTTALVAALLLVAGVGDTSTMEPPDPIAKLADRPHGSTQVKHRHQFLSDLRPPRPPTSEASASSVRLVGLQSETAALEVLGRDDEGRAVAELQQRLQDLRFWVGPVDGVFGWLTEQAVYAFQKANDITVDGLVGPETRTALADPVVASPRSSEGRVTEIDKASQLIYAVLDGRLEWVFHTSTGTELPYEHPNGYTALADTPPGSHTVFWQTERWEEGVLGPLYSPKYFHEDGIAVHGYDDIPTSPATHGCARVTFAAMDYIWEHGLMPMDSTVLVYGESPPP